MSNEDIAESDGWTFLGYDWRYPPERDRKDAIVAFVTDQFRRIADGFGPWEYAILASIWYDYGQVNSREELLYRAFGDLYDKHPSRALAAIDRCFQSGWIQFLTIEFLDRIQRELEEGGYVVTDSGLIGWGYEMPSPIGVISFAEAGAEV